MKMKIVTDSACDRIVTAGTRIEIVPLRNDIHIQTDAAVDSAVRDWLDAFGDAEAVFCLTLSGRMSGSYANALQAKEIYEHKYPKRCVYLLDSRTAGPEMTLLLERTQQLMEIGMPTEMVCRTIGCYRDQTRMLYALESAERITRSGRLSCDGLNGVGTMGIRLIGRVSRCGSLLTLGKSRGGKNTRCALLEQMDRMGYSGGKVIISHCENLNGAVELMRMIRTRYGAVDVRIMNAGETCSYYAQKGALMIGMEVSAERPAENAKKPA